MADVLKKFSRGQLKTKIDLVISLARFRGLEFSNSLCRNVDKFGFALVFCTIEDFNNFPFVVLFIDHNKLKQTKKD